MKFFTLLILLFHLSGWARCSDNSSIPQREYDDHGRLTKESFLNGKSIKISYDNSNRVIEIFIEGNGAIRYEYDNDKLLQVTRISSTGQNTYSQSYEYDDVNGDLLHENLIFNLGRISYIKDLNQRSLRIKSPYSEEICRFDSNGLLSTRFLDGQIFEYTYDDFNHLIPAKAQQEIPLIEYDQAGNLVKKTTFKGKYFLDFDADGKLLEVATDECKVNYFYDNFGRRIAKKTDWNGKEETETYLYFGDNDIAIYAEDGTLQQLRIPGLSIDDNFIRPIAIETQNEIYAVIHDYQGNLFKLIDTKNQKVIALPTLDPFGGNLNTIFSPTPWVFASKHYDAESHLIYFGSRYYDPELKQWITPDPLGTLQHSNVYLYCLGNPLLYFDPNGKFAIPLVSLVWGAGAVITFPAWGTAALVTATVAVAGWATYEVIQKVKEGNQRDGTPGWNGPQNDQFKDAKKEIENKIGRRLSQDEEDKLHRYISGQNYGYHEVVEEGYWLFNGQ